MTNMDFFDDLDISIKNKFIKFSNFCNQTTRQISSLKIDKFFHDVLTDIGLFFMNINGCINRGLVTFNRPLLLKASSPKPIVFTSKIESISSTFKKPSNFYLPSNGRVPWFMTNATYASQTIARGSMPIYDYVLIIDKHLATVLRKLEIDLLSESYLTETSGANYYKKMTFITIREFNKLHSIDQQFAPNLELDPETILGFFVSISATGTNSLNQILYNFSAWLKKQIDKHNEFRTQYILSFDATFTNGLIKSKDLILEIQENHTTVGDREKYHPLTEVVVV
jgi:hypothetical protein